MGTTNLRMSYGKCLSTPMLWGSMFGIVAISKGFHNMVIGSGQQPATMCAEFKAAETKRMMAKPCQAAEGKAMMQNPVSACHFDYDTGRAGKYLLQEGKPIYIVSTT